MTDHDKEKMWELFHRLWTRDARNANGYRKSEWKELEGLILQCLQTTQSQKTANTEIDHVGNANFL